MIILYNRDSIIWLVTRFIDIGETASQIVADLLTTNSKASDEIFQFLKWTPTSFWTQLLELHLAHREDFAINEKINDRPLSWYETDRN